MILKDKIQITTEFIKQLIQDGWKLSDTYNDLLDNIDFLVPTGESLKQTITKFSTNIDIFIGCLENLISNQEELNINKATTISDIDNTKSTESDVVYDSIDKNDPIESIDSKTDQNFEPFEYFVDFEEPVGLPLTDDDLY